MTAEPKISPRQILKPWIDSVDIKHLRSIFSQISIKDECMPEAKLRQYVYREQKNHADFRIQLTLMKNRLEKIL